MYRARTLLSKGGKQLSYPYVLLHHHANPSLLPPINPGSLAYVFHNAISATRAVAGFITSQSCRDRFLSLTGLRNDNSHEGHGQGIINTSVLGQSDVGFLKTLSLYQDLSNPLYDNSKFNIEEFMNGCGWALRQFHRSKNSLLTKVIQDCKDCQEDPKDADSANKDEVLLKSNYDFVDAINAAAAEPDSLENEFLFMTTPEIMENIKIECATRLFVEHVIRRNNESLQSSEIRVAHLDEGWRGNDVDTQVKNVALLSARVEEIYPPPHKDIEKVDHDPDLPLKDVFLTPHRNVRDKEPSAQVVVQLEVLYELHQSFADDEKHTHSQTSMLVGKFETCLDGDPNNENELQWKLCSYRPATEFGYFNS